VAPLGQRQTLGHDWMDLALTQQRDQRAEVLPKPIRVAGTSTNRRRSAKSTHGKHLVTFPELLDPEDEHPSTG
jgi:hypothetical protein